MGASKTEPKGAIPTLILPADCNVRTISAVAADARGRIAAGTPFVLDGSAVEAADVTFVQFVVSAQKLCAAQASPFRLESPSEAVLSAFSRSGVSVPGSAVFDVGAR